MIEQLLGSPYWRELEDHLSKSFKNQNYFFSSSHDLSHQVVNHLLNKVWRTKENSQNCIVLNKNQALYLVLENLDSILRELIISLSKKYSGRLSFDQEYDVEILYQSFMKNDF